MDETAATDATNLDAGSPPAEGVEQPIESQNEGLEQPDDNEAAPPKPKYRVKVEGEELEVELDELLQGYSRTADYTRKTQEAAELRRQAEAERQRFVQFNQEQIQAHQAVAGIDAQLQQFSQVNWQQLSDSDPVQAQKLWIQYQQLKDQRQHVAGRLAQFEQARAVEEQRAIARQVEEGHQVLAREIHNWNADTARAVRTFAEKELGFRPEELSRVYDPRVVRLLHSAMVASQLTKQARMPEQQAAPAKPVTKVGGTSSGPRDMNRMSTDDWMRARNAELRKRRA